MDINSISHQYVGVFFILIIIFVALKVIEKLSKTFNITLPSGRYNSIDGLRGIAALLVFASHAAAWWYYLITDNWGSYPIRLYGNIGQLGVIIFFMITGFLFTDKILKEKHGNRQIDWKQLLRSRIFRLTPLYLFTVIIVLALAARYTPSPQETLYSTLGLPLLSWILFTIPGTPDINGLKDTWLLTAGVTWSLPYEWFFYCALPVFATIVGIRPSMPWLIGALCLSAIIFTVALRIELIFPFAGGIITAFLVRQPRIVAAARRRGLAVSGLLLLFFAVCFFWNLFKPLPLVLITIFFAVAASGNSFFGLFDHRAVRLLGEISYSVYLLHGLSLYILIHEVIGVTEAKAIQPLFYWLAIVAITPLLILACAATFLFIERPMIKLGRGRASISTQAVVKGEF